MSTDTGLRRIAFERGTQSSWRRTVETGSVRLLPAIIAPATIRAIQPPLLVTLAVVCLLGILWLIVTAIDETLKRRRGETNPYEDD